MTAPSAARFAAAREVLLQNHERYNIGTYRERSQHLILKHYFEPDSDRHEIPLEGYIADIYSEAGVIEIQTSSFGALQSKLEAFLRNYPVTLVYPSAIKKRIIWTDPETGTTSVGAFRNFQRTRFSILSELFSISAFFAHPHLHILQLLTAASDYKLLDGFGKDRKGRATKTDTIPEELLEIVSLRDRGDILQMLPFFSGQTITNAEMAKAFGMRGMKLWRAVKFLEKIEVLYRSGKKGNSILYTIAD
ncbi:MAG: hypothetical protein HFE66_08640 [Clostridiales bacterium]|nr:hypothetical protein [Clostridiales bacterium]